MRKISTSLRLHESLSKLIESLPAGARLPSEPELAKRMGVSRATLREAMRSFETQGLLHRRQGAGTYISRPSQVIESGLEVLESLETLGQRIGLPVALGNIQVQTRPASDDEAHALGLNKADSVMAVARVILADNQPAAYLVDIVPASLLSPQDLQSGGFSGSVLDVLLRRPDLSTADGGLETSRCELSATTATPEIARLLAIQRGDVLLCFKSYLYMHSGRVADYSFSYFLPGHFRFHVVRRVDSSSISLRSV